MAPNRIPATAMLCLMFLLPAAFQLASATGICSVNSGTATTGICFDNTCSTNGGTCVAIKDDNGYYTSCMCQPRGEETGDPHFKGFDGYRFDMQGEDGKVYNLMSHKEVQANMQLAGVHGPWEKAQDWKQGHMVSFMSALAVKNRGGDVVVVEKVDGETVTVELNGLSVEFNSSMSTASGMTVSYIETEVAADHPVAQRVSLAAGRAFGDWKPATVKQVVIGTAIFQFTVDILPVRQRRLDVSVGLLRLIADLEGTVEGLLGHTVRAKHPTGAMNMKQVYNDTVAVNYPWGKVPRSAALEAEMNAKYAVPSGLLGDDFPLNKFKPDQPATAQQVLGERADAAEAASATVTGEQVQEVLEGAAGDAQDMRRRALLAHEPDVVDMAVFATASIIYA